MMSTGVRTLFKSGVQKNLKSLYQCFVPQKFAFAHVCADRYDRKNMLKVDLDNVVKLLCPKSDVKINMVQSLRVPP